MTTRPIRAMFALATIGMISCSVWATTLSDVTFQIRASNDMGSGTWELRINPEDLNGDYDWALPSPVNIMSSTGEKLGTLTEASLFYADPDGVDGPASQQVTLGFAVQAGALDTDFSIDSAFVQFAPIANASGRASASITATDVLGGGAVLTGSGPGGGAYLAQYNGFVPGGATFAEGIQSVIAPINGSNSGSLNEPNGGGFQAIGGSVANMSAQLNFNLTAFDIASGTSNYEIVPEPASLGLLLIGAATMFRRR